MSTLAIAIRKGEMIVSNKHAAKEDDIGKLHNLITKCHNMKAEAIMTAVHNMIEEGADPIAAALLINSKDLTAMQKWVEYNGITCSAADQDEESELSKRLRELKDKQKGKIVNFEDIREAQN